MTASSAPWLTWGITFPIRRWAIFCNDRGWARHPNANATPPGPRSSAGTRPCSGPPTSSPLKSGPPTGLTTYYVLFFLHPQTRRVILAGITPFPNEAWLKQIARNVTAADGPMANARFLLHDRDAKFSENFDSVFHAAGIEALKLPPQSPNLNAFAERWVRSVKEECLDQLILFGERSLRHVLDEYLAHHQHERNHQGLDNVIPFPSEQSRCRDGTIRKSERLGGLLNFYQRAA